MAIDDIISRIAADARSEAEELTSAARADAERTLAEARSRAERRFAAETARSRAEAEREAETLVANTRLSERDAMVALRQQLDTEALEQVVQALVDLDDARYAALLAREIAGSCDGCAELRLGSADAERLRRGLPAALASAGATLEIGDEPAGIERGVVLVGDRVRVEISPASLVAARRDDLLAMADAELFGRGD